MENRRGSNLPAPGARAKFWSMRIGKLAVTMLAVFVLGAIVVDSAWAIGNEYVEPAVSAWYTGASPGTKLASGSTVAITTSAASALVLESTLSGAPVVLQASGVNCVSCTIANVGTQAVFQGSLEFTGLTLSSPDPASCGVVKFVTKKLVGTVSMKSGSSTIATMKFVPESGGTLATIEIVRTGVPPCTDEGLFKLAGSFYAEMANSTGVFAKTQTIRMSEAIQKSAGEATSLKFGPNAAFLTGEIKDTALVEYAAKQS